MIHRVYGEGSMDRVTYTIGRLLQMVPTIIGITVLTFLLIHLIPGDPVLVILGIKATPESVAALTKKLGLGKPIWMQFVIFVKNLARGDLGDSLVYRVPVMTLVKNRLPLTLSLVAYAAVLSVVLTVPLAFVAALNKDTWIDQIIRGIFISILSVPAFWVGIVMLLIFGIRLNLFPVGGTGEGFFGGLYYLFLPALTIALRLVGILTRNLREGIISILDADYVDFARAKGLRERLVLTRHVLRNAMVSTVTLLGLNIGWMVGGSVVIESVFALPGVGWTMVQAIFGRDYPVVQGLTLIFGVLVSMVYLLTDIVYSFLDPRVTLD
jgi:peptide/nickel transport system permease protein